MCFVLKLKVNFRYSSPETTLYRNDWTPDRTHTLCLTLPQIMYLGVRLAPS